MIFRLLLILTNGRDSTPLSRLKRSARLTVKPRSQDDYRFYLSSLIRSAQDFASLVRQHWDIENKLHWSLDVTFNEDHSRIRKDNAPENMAALRRLALNLLRQNRSKSISLRQKRLLCSLDEDYLLQAISGAT